MKTFTKQLISAITIAAIAAFSPNSVFAQVKIGTNPTAIGTNNNLEVEGSISGRKTSIDKTTGKVTIADGSQGDSKILTSDVNGVATWQSAPSIRLEQVAFIGEQVGNYTITTFDGTYNSLKDRIPLTPRTGSLPGYDPTTKSYAIQEDGFYWVLAGAKGTGTLPTLGTGPGGTAGATTYTVYIHPFEASSRQPFISTADRPVLLNTFCQGYLTAGTEISVYATSVGRDQDIIVANGFLSALKLF